METSSHKDIEKELLEKKHDLEKRIKLLDKDARRKGTGPLDQNLEEQSILVQNDEVVDALSKRDREELAEVNGALEDIKNGLLGICHKCGSKISHKRKAAMPMARFCLNCSP